MGALVKQGDNALAAYGGVNPWAEAARGVDFGSFLNFNGNTGEISYGAEDTELPIGSQLVMDMQSLSFGWICWDGGQVVEEIFVSVVDGKPPMEHELTDHGPYNDDDDGWREATSISAVLLEYGEDANHPDVGAKLLFKTSTAGQVRSVRKLSGAYGKLFMQHPGQYPVVEVSSESYMPKQKKHGKKWSLIFKIVGWISEEELAGLTDGEADGAGDYEEEDVKPARGGRPAESAEEEVPAPRTRRRAAEPAEEDEEAPAPRTRRRAESAPVEETEEEEAPAPRTRRRAAPEPQPEAEEEEEASAPRTRRRAEPEPAEEDEDAAPTPRGRSAGRGAAPAGNARTRRFA